MVTSSEDRVSQLRLLAKLINNGVEDIIAEYRKAGRDLPDLDSADSNQIDVHEDRDDGLKVTVQTIQGACMQLLASVDEPGSFVTTVRLLQQVLTSNPLTKISDIFISKDIHSSSSSAGSTETCSEDV
jgi:hypothetical protein